MDQLYWIKEYLRVMLAFGFVMYLWPMVVFEKHLRGRSRTYRYAFCVTVPTMLISTVVLLLGLAHLLHPIVTTVLFYGVFVYQLYRNHGPSAEWFRDTRRAMTGTMGRKKFTSLYLSSLQRETKKRIAEWWASTRGKRLEYLLLLVLLAYGTLYFSYGAFDTHSYGASDEPVHVAWTYELLHGHAFAKGVYPEAMHCVIYLISTAFGISLYSTVLFLAGVYFHMIMIAVYLFMKEMFHWPYTGLLALTLFLTVDQYDLDAIFSMSRFSWTLPMEFAFHTPFLAALFLTRFLKGVMRGRRTIIHLSKPKEWVALLHNENLFIFLMSVAVSVAVHFYTTIFVAFFCIAVVIVYFAQVFRRGSFVPLVMAAILTLVISAAPMAAAFAIGYPPEGSLRWAMSLIEGDKNDVEESVPPETESEAEPQEIKSLQERAKEVAEIFYRGYQQFYRGIRAQVIVGATLLIIAFSVLFHLICGIAEGIRGLRARRAGTRKYTRVLRDYCDGYLIVAIVSVILMFSILMMRLGLPAVIEPYRACALSQLFSCMVCASLLDIPLALLAKAAPGALPQLFSCLLCAGACVLVWNTGMYHGGMFNMMMRYGAAVDVTETIVNTYPKDMFTIVSTTDEYYQLIDHGFHEEMLEFVQRITYSDYTLPTPYVFLYIEKRPFQYAQYRFARMPEWLAWEKYAEYFGEIGSQAPDVTKSEISKEAAGSSIYFGSKLSDSAADLDGRTVLESKAYQWYQKFSALYPNEGRVIYEDDDFLCYAFVQNKDCLYQLALITLEEDLASEPELLEKIKEEQLP